MGTWGAGIFDNDLASDVRGEYRELLEDGTSDLEATKAILRSFAYALNPDDEGCFWTGFAAAQVQLGRLEPAIRDRAVAVIDAGADLHMYGDGDPRDVQKRKAVLAKLRSQLLGAQKQSIKVRRPRRIPCPVQAGDIFLLILDDGRKARLRTLAVTSRRIGDIPTLELIDDQGRPYGQFYRDDDIRSKVPKETWARWQIFVGRIADVPTADEIELVAREAPPTEAISVGTSIGWRGLRKELARVLDEPNARPKA
jgi:hypothetical protein